jgi:hypothetical protein
MFPNQNADNRKACIEQGLYQVARAEPPRLISTVLQVDYT